jgi:hypothetical protein
MYIAPPNIKLVLLKKRQLVKYKLAMSFKLIAPPFSSALFPVKEILLNDKF